METNSNYPLDSDLSLKVQYLLNSYIEEKRNLTINGLANDKIKKSTLHDLKNGKYKSPSKRSIVEALKVINPNKSLAEIASKYEFDTELFKIITDFIDQTHKDNSNSVFVSNDYEEALKNEKVFQVIMLSESEEGISRDFAERYFGKATMTQIDQLIASGILKEENGVIHGEKEMTNVSVDTVKQLLINLLKVRWHNKKYTDTNQDGYLRLYYNEGNEEFLTEKLKELEIAHFNAVRKLFQDPRAKGTKTIAIGLLRTEVIDKNIINNKGETLQ